jgi:AbrB family looped-hinge helix DNA binding protein
MKSIVSEKGQVTIPKAIRDRLGLRAGTVVEFQAVEGKLVGVKSEAADGLRKWLGKGRLPAGLGVDAYLERIRG